MNDHKRAPKTPGPVKDLLVLAPFCWPDVTIFLISSDAAASWDDKVLACLSVDEKARSMTMTSPERRHRFLLGRAALRLILSAFDGHVVAEDAWLFGTAANGKPIITAPNNRRVAFNLSHAECFIAIAVSRTADIGVDIEVNHEIPELELPWHLFSGDEQRLLKTTAPKAFPDAFFRLWTLKEAIAKRTGLGFATEFKEINTLALPIIDGLDNITKARHDQDHFFHISVPVLDQTLHLAVSTKVLS